LRVIVVFNLVIFGLLALVWARVVRGTKTNFTYEMRV
jgi:hypothetical protein